MRIYQAFDVRDESATDRFFTNKREAVKYLSEDRVPMKCRVILEHDLCPVTKRMICLALEVLPRR